MATVSADGKITGVTPGTATIRGTVGDTTVSADVAVFPPLVELSLLDRHACGRSADGAIWCWGNNDNGELGKLLPQEQCTTGGGNFSCSTTPRHTVDAPAFAQVAAGVFRTCGRTISGETYCWGANGNGVLGPSTDTCPGRACNRTPVKTPGNVLLDWMATGDGFACGLTTAGAAYCWGNNAFGELGTHGGDVCGGTECSLSPIPVSGGLTFQSMTVGSSHSCGLTSSGTAYCWGINEWGQLGNGSFTDPFGGSAVPVAVSGGMHFVVVSAGHEHTCGIDTTGKAWCWGADGFGRIGDGTPGTGVPSLAYSVPHAVTGNIVFTTIAEGLQHTCALTAAGAAYCWGANNRGQLGDGTTETRVIPVRVLLDVPLVEIKGGRNGTCGRTSTGKVYCWGTNLYGRLGIGTQTPEQVTQPVGVGGVP